MSSKLVSQQLQVQQLRASVVKEGRAKKLSFTSIREKLVIIKRTVTDRRSHRLRLKKLTDND